MKFEGFSEAARLYADNLHIIKQMEQKYKDSIEAFLTAVHLRMQELSDARSVEVYKENQSICWWLADEETKQSKDEEIPYIYIDRNKYIEIDSPGVGVLTLRANVDEAPTELKEALINGGVWLQSQLPPYCKYAKRGRLFDVVIKYEYTCSVDLIAEPALMVMKELLRVWKDYYRMAK